MSDPVTTFKVSYPVSPSAGRLALLTMDNGHDHTKPTTLGVDALASLERALDEVAAQSDVKGLLLTGKPFVFAAGADLNQFADVSPEDARYGVSAGHDAFRRLASLEVPTLAAINGATLGGGLELALHCDYRTLSETAGPIAFPEVFLSILPGWGGTQLAPRLLGSRAALQLIIHNALSNNRMIQAREAFDLGLADRLLAPVDFLEQSLALLERLITGEETITRPAPDERHLDEALTEARKVADDRTHGATPAPYRAIDLVEHAARGGDLEEGRQGEIDAMAELVPARQAQASIYAFNLVQSRVRKQPWKPDAEPKRLQRIGVVGAGLMGSQLGALWLQRYQVPLVMKDLDQEVLARSQSTIEGELDKRVQRGRLDAAKAEWLKSVVTYTVDDADLAGCDLVIEAVVERMDVKKRVFADLERVLAPDAVLATNTSSLSVAEMAADLQHPERVLGLHFFNPVSAMPLLEVVRPPHVSDETMATGFAAAKTLRKSGVQVADAPGFVVNRILMRFMGACGDAANRGNAFADIDDAIKGLGLPMGPFELLGLVGLEVGAHVLRVMHEGYPDRFPLDANFQMLAETGLPGVYDWDRGRVPYDEIRERWQVLEGAEPLTPDQIRTQALEAVADEARHMLDEGVVADARDIDTCMILGAGWPFFNGGICKHLDQIGLSEKLFGEPLVGPHDRAAG